MRYLLGMLFALALLAPGRHLQAQTASNTPLFLCQWANHPGGCPTGYDQNTANCGPASVLMTISAYTHVQPTGADITNADVWLAANIPGYKYNSGLGSGTEPGTLARLAAELGFPNSTPFANWTVDQLKQELAQGYPVIVRVRPGMNPASPTAHYMVLTTLVANGTNGVVVMDNPGLQKGQGIAYPLDQFLSAWAQPPLWNPNLHNQGLIIHPNGPPTFPNVTISEFPLAMAGDIVNGPDGALWAALDGVPRGAARIATGGTFTFFNDSSEQETGGIALGPDGALWLTGWFGGYQPDQISRLTTSGVQTNFQIPTLDAFPLEIVPGPDKALWFTEGLGNRIGRITTSGAVSEYPITSALPYPIGITTGPDDAIWFTESGTNKIGRMDTLGNMTNEFQLSGYAWGITVGPDQNLWFTEPDLGNIGRLTPSGTLTEFPIPTRTGAPLNIVVGPDNALWFTEEDGNNIGRMTIDGTSHEYPVPSAGSQPFGITLGPDKAVWFTEQKTGKVGKVVVQ